MADIYNMTDTWNAGGTTFTAIKMDVTNTASASGSKLIDLQIASATVFSIRKDGQCVSAFFESGSGGFLTPTFGTVGVDVRSNDGFFRLGSDTTITRAGAAAFCLGAANAASPVAQTLGTQGSRAGTDSNVGGANLTIRAGNGTGTGTLATLALQSPVSVASGTGAQTQTTGLTIRAGTAVMTSYTVATLPVAATAGAGARAFVTDALSPVFGSAVTGGGAVGVPVYSTGSAWNVG